MSTPLINSLLSASTVIVCGHPQCRTPAAAIVGNTLVIRHRHHGQQHVTVLNMMALASALFFGV